jgi:spore coat polysaccharide biosynthesis protein SpsF
MFSNELGIIVFARTDSMRLPGKALMPLGGIPLLLRVIQRAQLTGYPVYLATSDMENDNALVRLAEDAGIGVFRGSKDDVLGRALSAAQHFNLRAFARLCGDRPLFSINEIVEAFSIYKALMVEGHTPDLITNHLFKQQAPGLTTEIIDVAALMRMEKLAHLPLDREHITHYLYAHKTEFYIVSMPQFNPPPSHFGWAVDTPNDYERLSFLFNHQPSVGMQLEEAVDILSHFQNNEHE